MNFTKQILVLALSSALLCACEENEEAPADAGPNTAPQISIGELPAILDEGQTFIVDASESVDSDDDDLRFEITLGDTRFAEVKALSTPSVWEIVTKEVDQNEIVSVTVSVSDGTDTVSETFDVTIANYNRMPLFEGWQGPVDTYTSETEHSRKLPYDVGLSGTVSLNTFARTGENSAVIEYFPLIKEDGFGTPAIQEIDAPSPGEIEFFELQFDWTWDRFASDYVVLSKADGRIQTYAGVSDDLVTKTGDMTVPGACHIAASNVVDVANPEPDLLVSTDNGLHALLNGSNLRETSAQNRRWGEFFQSTIIATNGDYCLYDKTWFALPHFYGAYYDRIRNEIIPLNNSLEPSAEFGTPITVTAPLGLRVVDFQSGTNLDGTLFYAILFAGETHESAQQLTIVQVPIDGAITQTDVALPSGIPTRLHVRRDGEIEDIDHLSEDTDIAIMVPDTPYIYVLDNLSTPEGGTGFGPVQFFEVGFGVEDIDFIYRSFDSVYKYYHLVTNDGDTLTLYPSVEGN